MYVSWSNDSSLQFLEEKKLQNSYVTDLYGVITWQEILLLKTCQHW